jgi:hypothetical protein
MIGHTYLHFTMRIIIKEERTFALLFTFKPTLVESDSLQNWRTWGSTQALALYTLWPVFKQSTKVFTGLMSMDKTQWFEGIASKVQVLQT